MGTSVVDTAAKKDVEIEKKKSTMIGRTIEFNLNFLTKIFTVLKVRKSQRQFFLASTLVKSKNKLGNFIIFKTP